MKFGNPMQNEMPITVIRSKLKLEEVPIWRTFVFRNRKYLITSRGLSYPDEMVSGPEDSDVTQSETGSKIAPLRRLS